MCLWGVLHGVRDLYCVCLPRNRVSLSGYIIYKIIHITIVQPLSGFMEKLTRQVSGTPNEYFLAATAHKTNRLHFQEDSRIVITI